MFVSIINDCSDQNAMTRQATRALTFFDSPVSTLGVANDMEAAGNLIDVLDAADEKKGVILVNVAPRHGMGKKWPNGTPFGYFSLGETLVISTVDGFCLSLVKKLGLANSIHLLDVPTVMDHIISLGRYPKDLRSLVVDSQFRSYEFIPRVANWLQEGIEIPHEEYDFSNVADIPQAVWWVDNFGNCKTTLFADEAGYAPGKTLKTTIGDIACYEKLKDVPTEGTGIIVGSSGIGNRRFLEVVIRGKSASATYSLHSGSPLF